jgi:hypothetical protein
VDTLERAEMTPLEVIVTSTRLAAEVLKLDPLGTVAAGKSADLVVLDANPWNQISNIRKISEVYLHGQEGLGQYVLLKPFLVLVTLKVPSCRADSLIQYALPLWAGGGGVPGPGCGAGVGATGIMGAGASTVLAMNIPGTVYSCPLRSEK